MYDVKLYIAADSLNPHVSRKKYMYCLECRGTELKGSGETFDSWHGANLEAICAGLKRITNNCTITIYTLDKWLIHAFKDFFPGWRENGFVNYKGDKVEHHEKWQEIHRNESKMRIFMEPVEAWNEGELMGKCEASHAG
jgi:ribonuclease HI